MEQSFENIKVGDIVIFESGGWYNYTIIDKVTLHRNNLKSNHIAFAKRTVQ